MTEIMSGYHKLYELKNFDLQCQTQCLPPCLLHLLRFLGYFVWEPEPVIIDRISNKPLDTEETIKTTVLRTVFI